MRLTRESALAVAVGGTLATWYTARVRAGRFAWTIEHSTKISRRPSRSRVPFALRHSTPLASGGVAASIGVRPLPLFVQREGTCAVTASAMIAAMRSWHYWRGFDGERLR